MQERKPRRMILHEKRNESYPQDIEQIATKPPRGDIKQLRYLKFEIRDLNSDRSDGEDEPKEDETLLDTRTAPNNGSARTREETNRDIIHPVRRIAEKGNEAIDHRRHMNRHRLKESRQIKPEPCYLFAALVSEHREFPEIISSQQRDHKNDHVAIGCQDFFYFL